VEDLADTTLAQKISQLSGVGLVSISGGQRPAVRIQANPTALASYGLSLEDLRTALSQSNVDQAKGTFDGLHQAYTIGANDQLISSNSYRPLIIAYRNGAPVRLTDVATVSTVLKMPSRPPGPIGTPRHSEYSTAARREHHRGGRSREETSSATSSGASRAVHVDILTDRTTTIRASVEDVQFTLVLTVALVVMVIFLFLRSLRATIIPSIAVPLSLIGTFGVMYLLGYSLNNLSLMALTISTGFVVDDAIVMIETSAVISRKANRPCRRR